MTCTIRTFPQAVDFSVVRCHPFCMSSTSSGQLQLDRLPPETWGQRLQRAREHIAGLSLQAASVALGEMGWEVSYMTLSRIEKLDQPPVSRKHRQHAIFALVVYGLDPADFELSLDELPRSARPSSRKKAGHAPFPRAKVAA